MKLINCPICLDLVMLISKYTRKCICGEVAGKYLADNITAVVNEGAIVVGIDNNGLSVAREYYFIHKQKFPNDRIDTFFTGWIPNLPGEVIIVDSIEEVESFDCEHKVSAEQLKSTLPTANKNCGETESFFGSILRRHRLLRRQRLDT